jgi:hypothetical protein
MGKQIGQSVNSATRTTLSFIPGMKFCLLPSTFHLHISRRLARAARRFRSLSALNR